MSIRGLENPGWLDIVWHEFKWRFLSENGSLYILKSNKINTVRKVPTTELTWDPLLMVS